MSALSEALDRLGGYNLGPFSEADNPLGLTGKGAVDANLEPMLGDVVTAAGATGESASAAAASQAAAAGYRDQAQAAATSAAAAAGEGRWCGTAAGASNALVLTPSPAVAAPFNGLMVRFLPTTVNGQVTRKNWLRNSVAAGAVVGGTPPTNWFWSGSHTATVAGSGTEDGTPYLDLRTVGTAAGSGRLCYDANNAIVALPGQVWASAAGCKLVAGSLTNVTLKSRIAFRDAAATLAQDTSRAFAPTAVAARYPSPLGTAPAGTVYVQGWLEYIATGAFDVTLRLYLPQVEQDRVSPPIPTAGTARDVVDGHTVVAVSGGANLWLLDEHGNALQPNTLSPTTPVAATYNAGTGDYRLAPGSTAPLFWGGVTGGTANAQVLQVPRPALPPGASISFASALTSGSVTRQQLSKYTEALDNAAWIKANMTVVANAAPAPTGALTMDKLVPSTTNTLSHTVTQEVTVPAGAVATKSVYLAAAGYNYALVRLADTTEAIAIQCIVDLASGTVVYGSAYGTGATLVGAKILAVGGGVHRVALTGSIAGQTTYRGVVYVYNSLATTAYAGDGTSGIYAWGDQVETGAVATAYMANGTGAALSVTDGYMTLSDLPLLSAAGQPLAAGAVVAGTQHTAVMDPYGCLRLIK